MLKLNSVYETAGFVASESHSCFLLSDGTLSINGTLYDKLKVEVKRASLWLIGHFLLIDNKFGSVCIFDLSINKVLFSNDIHSEELYLGNFLRFISFDEVKVMKIVGGETKYGVLDLRKFSFKEISVDFEISYRDFFYRKEIVSNEKTVVKAFDNNLGECVWQYDDFREYKTLLSGEVKTESVRSMLALVGETLWVLLDTGRIVGLDPMTGECKKNIEIDDVDLTHFENAETDFINARGIGSAYVSGEEKVLYLSSNVYFEIDLTADKPTRVCYNVKQTFKDRDVTGGGHQCVNSRYVFFNESMIGTIGAFDRQTKKVVWVDKLKNHKPDAGAVRELKATEKQLYVHDNKQNLFVFDLT